MCLLQNSQCTCQVLRCGATQTLSFRPREGGDPVRHEELEQAEEGLQANHGAHLSMYVADLPGAYARAEAAGALFVNQRFKRRASPSPYP